MNMGAAREAMLATVPVCTILLYRSWLEDRTLFFDEWMYFEELADLPSRLR
jgi:hypothetical protein